MKKILFTLVTLLAFVAAQAESYTYLNFIGTDQQITQVLTDNLVITFSEGNAVVQYNGDSQTIALAGLDYMEFTETSQDAPFARGDINGDGLVDVTDVDILIDIVLGKAKASDFTGAPANLNGDTLVDVTDVGILIDIVLGKEA